MKVMVEFKSLSVDELKKRLVELKKELLKLNAQVISGANPSSPGKIGQIKKNIARILTLLQEKGVEQE